MQHNLRLRSDVAMAMRKFLVEHHSKYAIVTHELHFL